MTVSARDVVIVGGGPAGLATAIEARMRGLEVLVLDRRRPPIDKPCGEGLMPDGLARLEAMGVRAEGKPFFGIRYLDGTTEAAACFPSVDGRPLNGLGVRRTRLHQALVRRAESLGVVLGWGVEVAAVDVERGQLETVEPFLGARRHGGGHVVGADGLRSKIRTRAGLDGAPSAVRRFGVRRHYEMRPWSEKVEVYWTDRAEAYVTPVGEGEVGVAILWSGGKGGFDHWLGLFPALASRLASARVASRHRGTGPLRQRASSVVRGRLALVGDAAGYVDAITGEGLSVAFHQAAALGQALGDGDLDSYRRRHREIVRLPDAMTELLLWVERHPRLRRRVVRALAREPRLFRQFLAVHCRHAPAWTLGPRAPSLLWQLAKAG